MSYLLPTVTTKEGVDELILNCIDKVLVLRFGRAPDAVCLQQDDILAKSVRELSKFATIGLVDVDAEDVQVYVKYFDITYIPATIFFFNAEHMKMDCGTPDHTKWIGAFHNKQDFVDVVEERKFTTVTSGCAPRPYKRRDNPNFTEGQTGALERMSIFLKLPELQGR